MATVKNIAICLFRNDLRIHDNEMLSVGAKADLLLPLYCFDPRHFGKTYYFGFPKTGPHRARFLRESVVDLNQGLQKLGSRLIVRLGKPEVVLPDIIATIKKTNPNSQLTLHLHKEVADEEIRVEKALEKCCKSVPIKYYWGATLYHLDDLPFKFSQLPDVFTTFRKKVESPEVRIRALFPTPQKLPSVPSGISEEEIPKEEDLCGNLKLDLPVSVEEIKSITAFPFCGGETAALDRLDDYFWRRNLVQNYKETRNGLVGPDYSSKFSPWLALGCISPRKINSELASYEQKVTSNQSTYWLFFELLWRDYFRFVAMKYGNRLFHLHGLQLAKSNPQPWKTDQQIFNAWRLGKTGVPFVDANMRELLCTGFMSNRGRQNVASFLAKDLHLDWRLGAEWFEMLLIDSDVYSNYGNWTYSAGVGNDPRESRKFNIIKQAKDYDPKGEYVKLWCPEVRSVGEHFHHPWTRNSQIRPIALPTEWTKHYSQSVGNNEALNKSIPNKKWSKSVEPAAYRKNQTRK